MVARGPRHGFPGCDALAGNEPPFEWPEAEPVHAERYRQLIGGAELSDSSFYFGAESNPEASEVTTLVTDEDGVAVSMAFSTRWGAIAAECGVDTAEDFRGRGCAVRVVATWAKDRRAREAAAVQHALGEHRSRAVARQLGLTLYAAGWSLSGRGGAPSS